MGETANTMMCATERENLPMVISGSFSRNIDQHPNAQRFLTMTHMTPSRMASWRHGCVPTRGTTAASAAAHLQRQAEVGGGRGPTCFGPLRGRKVAAFNLPVQETRCQQGKPPCFVFLGSRFGHTCFSLGIWTSPWPIKQVRVSVGGGICHAGQIGTGGFAWTWLHG